MLYKIDKDGIVVNEAGKNLIQKEYLPILEEINEFYVKEFGGELQSVYIRGSVSVGRAKSGVSDVDSVAIISKSINKQQKDKVVEFSREIESKYPFITLADLTVISLDELLNNKEFSNLKIYLKTQSVCLYGKDVVKDIPDVKPGKALALAMYGNLSEQLDELVGIFSGKQSEKTYLGEKRPLEFWCIWTMRLLLRSALGLVMIRRPVYSQDLGTCLEIFSESYPEHAAEMKKALFFALNPSGNQDQLGEYLNAFCPKYIKLWKEELNH